MTALPGVRVSPPLPLIWLATVVMTPLESIVPPPAPRVMLRVAPSVVAEVTCSVPPLKLRPPPAAPRLESDEIDSVPPLIAQDVVAAVVLVSVHVLAPVFSKLPKPWYCAPLPIWLTLKLASVPPPSCSFEAPAVVTTLPVITEPDCSCRTLLRPPVKVMALACAPPPPAEPAVMLPLLVMLRSEPTMATPPAPATPGLKPAPPAPP